MSDVPLLDPPSQLAIDALPVHETSINQIDMNAVQEHIKGAIERERYEGASDPLDYLRSHNAVASVGEDDYLTLTGLLCFSRKPQEIFPHAVIDLKHYGGRKAGSNEVIHFEEEIGGTLFQQLNRLEHYLWENTHHRMILSPSSMQPVEQHEYPRAVIRELGVNMVAHRDYTIYTSTACVQLFRNRIEWISPADLPEELTIENILTEQWPHNPHIMRVLYEAGYVEAFGQGLDTVITELQQEEMVPPLFKDTSEAFIVTVYGRIHDAVYDGEGERIELSKNQRLMLTFIRTKGWVTPRNLRDIFPDRSERSIQRDLKVLLEHRLIAAHSASRGLKYAAYSRPI